MAKHRKGNPDHRRARQQPAVEDKVIAAELEQVLSPLVYNQMSYYRQLGLRERILGLPLMVAAVLRLLWRQVPSVNELSRMLSREDLLWCKAVKVSQQSLSKRLLEFPSVLFERVFFDLLPRLRRRWYQRHHRPVPVSVQWAQQRFEWIWAVDGSTLEALFRHLKSLQQQPVALAGKIYRSGPPGCSTPSCWMSPMRWLMLWLSKPSSSPLRWCIAASTISTKPRQTAKQLTQLPILLLLRIKT